MVTSVAGMNSGVQRKSIFLLHHLFIEPHFYQMAENGIFIIFEKAPLFLG